MHQKMHILEKTGLLKKKKRKKKKNEEQFCNGEQPYNDDILRRG